MSITDPPPEPPDTGNENDVRPVRVLLDTSAINWLADHPSDAAEFFGARESGRIKVLVPPEVAQEVRNTRGTERRAVLVDVLSKFFPLTPTRMPRLGAFRLGMGRVSTEADQTRFDGLAGLKGVMDRQIATNADGYRCDVFLTTDGEMSRTKRADVEKALGITRVLEPEALIAELRTDQRAD